MGIGLSVVDKIIELHQGILSFDSEVWQGFLIRIQIPRK
jgi:signal transduction histidine kinase